MRRAAIVLAFILCLRILSIAAGRPGQFDYYVLSLSWSPEFCSDPQRADRDPVQCGESRRFAFVVHGLWPNYERPPHPRDCAPPSRVPPPLVQHMLQMMPSPRLIQHEWDSHGTCSGMSPQDYFAAVRAAFRQVNIPSAYRSPRRDLRVSAEEVRRNFHQSNPAFPISGIRLTCSGQYLNEARLCLDRKLGPRVCPVSVRDTCGSRVVSLRRVR